MTALLATRHLTRRFGGITAVDGVDFTLEEGGVHALIGPNGAGKSTFVGLIAGRIAPSDGTVSFLGRDVTGLSAPARMRLGMAYTFQITSIFARLPVRENVALAVQARFGRRDGARVEAALGAVGLGERAGGRAGDLAYGHQRLLEFAMGLAQQPRLLILDEPTQGLADGEIATVAALVEAARATTTVLLIEHNMDVVTRLADAITVLAAGRILASGTPGAVRADPAVRAAYLGTDAAGGA